MSSSGLQMTGQSRRCSRQTRSRCRAVRYGSLQIRSGLTPSILSMLILSMLILIRVDLNRGLPIDGAFENAVVIRIGGNEIEVGLCDDNLRNLGDQADTPLKVRFPPTKIPPQDLRDLHDYGD